MVWYAVDHLFSMLLLQVGEVLVVVVAVEVAVGTRVEHLGLTIEADSRVMMIKGVVVTSDVSWLKSQIISLVNLYAGRF